MHIIVTHTNADFDAVASLLAAWHLYPEAKAVLPPTLNRNVRDFVTLYENMLPFIHQNELGRETIDQLTIVDTQHLPSLKKIAPNAKIHIIDHHHDLPEPPPGVVLSLTDTGANVTLLVERIRNLPKRLTALEATLMLLGIYEDTGSLTYGNTTPRDLQAASWLLSDGHARLDIMREYLNYPMSAMQQALYEELIENLETHQIHGHTIAIGLARVDHYVEEIAGLASRIRDLYQPDGLFILVDMIDHVQLVARSATDAVNVGHLTEFFGGGGHPRAAAALVKGKSLGDIKHKLLRLLPLEVQPAVTVGQIMSRGVKTLNPDATVRDTATAMERYGHEGFPVIEPNTGQIVGIMSRREVDKARRHKLDGAAIRQFMKKGEFYVTPADGIDAVQALMTNHQIGQVPVVDQPGGKLLGVVTRTDLINLWHTSRVEAASVVNLGQQLRLALSAPLLNLLHNAGASAYNKGDMLYIVGGFVRDLLLSLLLDEDPAAKSKTSPRFDLDLVVEGDAIALANRLQEVSGGRVRSHSRFGTAKWILDKPIPFNPDESVPLTSLDFVTARTEFYRHPSALPEIEQSSVRQDLHRRDFTINTLALNLSPEDFGQLLDFYGGQNDLEARLIRVLHSLSFVEDPTRMLRAARLMARLDFVLEERTAELLDDALDLLDRVSGERIFHELELICQERAPANALQVLDQLGILKAIHPELVVDDQFMAWAAQLCNGLAGTPWRETPAETIHYLGLMTFSMAGTSLETLVERLNLRLQQRKVLQDVTIIKRNIEQIANARKASLLYQLLAPVSADARLITWLAVDNSAAKQQLTWFETELRDVAPLIDGNVLKETFKLRPGPLFRTILDALRDARLDGQVKTLADEHALVNEVISRDKSA